LSFSFFSELSKSLAEYVKLVPNEFHRKFYLRIFKWTLAFGVWNKPNPQIEKIKAKLAADDSDDEEDEPFDDNTVSGSQQGDGMPIRGVSLLRFVAYRCLFKLSSFCFTNSFLLHPEHSVHMHQPSLLLHQAERRVQSRNKRLVPWDAVWQLVLLYHRIRRKKSMPLTLHSLRGKQDQRWQQEKC
jgi:hypothetical protein